MTTIGILQADEIRAEWGARYGQYPDMVQRMLNAVSPGLSFDVYNVTREQFPDAASDCDAYVITGSKADAFDDEPWILQLLAFVRELQQRRIRLLGICFGHQIIARALGGEFDAVVARYASTDVRVAGFLTGPEYLAGRPALVLASASPRRRALLDQIGAPRLRRGVGAAVGADLAELRALIAGADAQFAGQGLVADLIPGQGLATLTREGQQEH